MTRRALEAFGAAEFAAGRLTGAELRRLLGFETRLQLDAFLKAHEIFEAVTVSDLERDRQDLRRLGF